MWTASHCRLNMGPLLNAEDPSGLSSEDLWAGMLTTSRFTYLTDSGHCVKALLKLDLIPYLINSGTESMVYPAASLYKVTSGYTYISVAWNLPLKFP